jgi:hypothetical protein
MSYDYNARQVWVDPLAVPIEPGAAYAFCTAHAGRLTPPVGWTLSDRRGPAHPVSLALEVA